MIINTTRFGEIEVAAEKLFHFKHGLPGFPAEKSFALLPYQPDSPFAFLQSSQDPNLAFLVVDPFAFFTDYEFELDDGLLQEMGLSGEIPPQIINIVTVSKELSQMTVNLVAPIIINPTNGQALQLVLEGTSYLTRHRLFENKTSVKGVK